MITMQCPHCGRQVSLTPIGSDQAAECAFCGKILPAATVEAQPFRSTSSREVDPLKDTLAADQIMSVPDDPYTFLSPAQNSDEIGWLAHYRVFRVLGKGGMGVVFEAEDTRLLRPVALKVMLPAIARQAEARQRFMREARATAALKSDHIINIYDVGEANEVPYIAMELLQGNELDHWIQVSGKLTPEEVIRVGLQLARGLEVAHGRGLIHRDIKPSNIWIEGSTNRVKILDFGLARLGSNDAHLTQTGSIMGTPAYMSPEQAEGASLDARSDLFSLGCVLYELATGDVPFTGTSTLAVLRAVTQQHPQPPRKINPLIPSSLSALILGLLAKKPADRPESATRVVELLEALEANSNSRVVHKNRLSVVGRSGRWFRRGAAMALIFILLLAGYLSRRAFSGPTSLDPTDESGSAVKQADLASGEIVLGMTAPFSGSSRELGRGMQLGIETCLRNVNSEGGVKGRKLRLIALDDGYEPDRALANTRELIEQHKTFGIIGSVGTPTAEKVVPYLIDKKILFFGAFTGARFLRKQPPDRYVFNYRASYEEETAAVIRYLIEIRKIRPEEIAVFAQKDAFGDSGFEGVVRTMRKYNRVAEETLRVGYVRNTIDVDAAVAEILRHKELRAVVMVATYRPASRFIQRIKDARRNLIFTNVSFVGSLPLSEDLFQLGPNYATGVIVSQVVPPVDSQGTAIIRFRDLSQKYFPSEQPSFVSLEGYLNALILVEGLRRVGDNLTTETLIDALESIRNLDLGIGAVINYGPSEHQASHKVWATLLNADGHYSNLDLD